MLNANEAANNFFAGLKDVLHCTRGAYPPARIFPLFNILLATFTVCMILSFSTVNIVTLS